MTTFVLIISYICMNFYTIFTYVGLLCNGKRNVKIYSKIISKCPGFTQKVVVFYALSRLADLAEQWSGKIKSVGKVAVLM